MSINVTNMLSQTCRDKTKQQTLDNSIHDTKKPIQAIQDAVANGQDAPAASPQVEFATSSLLLLGDLQVDCYVVV